MPDHQKFTRSEQKFYEDEETRLHLERAQAGDAWSLETVSAKNRGWRARRRDRGESQYFAITSMKRKDHRRTVSKRGGSKGWTPHALRENAKFLQSIDTRALEASGYQGVFLTLTFRDVPETPQAARACYRGWQNRMRYWYPTALWHWVMEFQHKGRNCPHFHVVFYVDGDVDVSLVGPHALTSWLKSAAQYRPAPEGQHYRRIYSINQLVDYVMKHETKHPATKQRAKDKLPEAWNGRVLGVWGKSRNWPMSELLDIALPTDMAENRAIANLQRKMRETRNPKYREKLRQQIDSILNGTAEAGKSMTFSEPKGQLSEHSSKALVAEVLGEAEQNKSVVDTLRKTRKEDTR